MTNGMGTCERHGEFVLTEGCAQCLAEKKEDWTNPAWEEEVQLKIKVTAPPGAPEGEEEKVAEEIVKLGEIIAEIQGAPKPDVLTMSPDPNAWRIGEEEVRIEETIPAVALIRIKPEVDSEVMSFYNEALNLKEYAEGRIITTVQDLKPAVDDLSIIGKVKKALEDKRKEYLQPLQNHVKGVNEAFKTLMLPIEDAERITKEKMLAFNTEQNRIRQEQERINQMRLEAAQAEAELKNGEITESVNLIEVAPEAPKTVYTEMGTAGLRDSWRYEVVDFALLPDEYKVEDSAMLNAVAKKHHDTKRVAGVRFYNEPIIARGR